MFLFTIHMFFCNPCVFSAIHVFFCNSYFFCNLYAFSICFYIFATINMCFLWFIYFLSTIHMFSSKLLCYLCQWVLQLITCGWACWILCHAFLCQALCTPHPATGVMIVHDGEEKIGFIAPQYMTQIIWFSILLEKLSMIATCVYSIKLHTVNQY